MHLHEVKGVIQRLSLEPIAFYVSLREAQEHSTLIADARRVVCCAVNSLCDFNAWFDRQSHVAFSFGSRSIKWANWRHGVELNPASLFRSRSFRWCLNSNERRKINKLGTCRFKLFFINFHPKPRVPFDWTQGWKKRAKVEFAFAAFKMLLSFMRKTRKKMSVNF